eukprot:19917-Heterococcus_DN1.PRE.1
MLWQCDADLCVKHTSALLAHVLCNCRQHLHCNRCRPLSHAHTHTQWEDEEKKINANPQRDGIELWHIEGTRTLIGHYIVICNIMHSYVILGNSLSLPMLHQRLYVQLQCGYWLVVVVVAADTSAHTSAKQQSCEQSRCCLTLLIVTLCVACAPLFSTNAHRSWRLVHVHLIDHVLLYGTGRETDLYADWDALRNSKGVFNSITHTSVARIAWHCNRSDDSRSSRQRSVAVHSQRYTCSKELKHSLYWRKCRILLLMAAVDLVPAVAVQVQLRALNSDDDCAGSACNAQKQCVMKPCGTDINCPLGTYCIANACVANGLRDWEQDVPKGDSPTSTS